MRLSRIHWNELKYALWLPLYLLAFVLIEHLPQPSYWATQLPLDDAIPFCEWFVLFYCAWYPLLVTVGIYLLLRDAPAFRRYMAFLAVTFFASVLIWLLIPNGQDLRPQVFPRENLPTTLVAALYRIDTNTNVFPSVHVVGSVGAALGRPGPGSPDLYLHPVHQAALCLGCGERAGSVSAGRYPHLPHPLDSRKKAAVSLRPRQLFYAIQSTNTCSVTGISRPGVAR